MEPQDGQQAAAHGNECPPIVAFYSVSGGVGKTTLAKKFAELITIAPGTEGRNPNVLLVDLDIDSQGLTYRLRPRTPLGLATVHQMIAQRNVVNARAVNVTASVSLTGGNPTKRGEVSIHGV